MQVRKSRRNSRRRSRTRTSVHKATVSKQQAKAVQPQRRQSVDRTSRPARQRAKPTGRKATSARGRGAQAMSPGRRRRASLHARKRATTTTGLSSSVVPALSRDGRKKGGSRVKACSKAKSQRRAVIIATGHGGRNGARNYRRHNPC